jgi:hypothetical protein
MSSGASLGPGQGLETSVVAKLGTVSKCWSGLEGPIRHRIVLMAVNNPISCCYDPGELLKRQHTITNSTIEALFWVSVVLVLLLFRVGFYRFGIDKFSKSSSQSPVE